MEINQLKNVQNSGKKRVKKTENRAEDNEGREGRGAQYPNEGCVEQQDIHDRQ